MKNYILSAALLTCSLTHAEETPTNAPTIGPPNHRIYIGPDLFFSRLKAFKKHSYPATYSSHQFYGGLRVGYDRLSPNSLYLGTDGLFAIGSASTKTSPYYAFLSSSYVEHTSPLWINLEQRIGYTCESPLISRFTLAPFIGAGWYYLRDTFNDSSYYTSAFYGALGLRNNQRFTENFDVGFNLKAMYFFSGRVRLPTRFGTAKLYIANTWGYEFSLPLTWHVGSTQRWDLQLQPYLLKLTTDSENPFLGIRLLLGYAF